MLAALLLMAASQLPAPGTNEQLRQALLRVSEEAEVFRLMAPKMIAQETLVQRARKPPRRFRPRIGAAATLPPKIEYRSREIISEYGFSSLSDSPGALHELRQVISVDGRRIASEEKARHTLTIGIRSDDDRVKKRMLERFEKHGLIGAATDFGQVLLLFARRKLDDFTFSLAGEDRVGAEAALTIAFRQRAGTGSLLIFEKRKAIHQALEGELWVRRSDGLPLRVVLRSQRKEGEAVVRDEASVDYAMTPHGVLGPAAVVHRQHAGRDLVVENVFRYSPFQVFAADAAIKFTEGPPAEEKQPKKP